MLEAHSENPDPVDLTHLRDITDGQKEVEEELFELFFSNAAECIAVLHNNCSDEKDAKWRSAAHELKGSAASLGAFKLSAACHQAQEAFTAPADEKRAILNKIKSDIEEVKHFLENLSYS